MVTSYGRKALFEGLQKVGKRAIYVDTGLPSICTTCFEHNASFRQHHLHLTARVLGHRTGHLQPWSAGALDKRDQEEPGHLSMFIRL